MTLASDLAHVICTGIIPEPGVIHDPTQPLVLGNQAANDYTVITWDPVSHRVRIQSVYQPISGPLQQSVLTFDSMGALLINGSSLAVAVPEIADAVSLAQTAAASATAAAVAAQTSEANAVTSASTAGAAASDATTAAQLSQDYATAPTGTPLPGGGDSSAVSAQKANAIAVESRDLDVSDPISANETFQSGYLFTERQVANGSNIEIIVPPGIFSSSDKKSRWGAYRLRGTGSVKFSPQAGGTNLVAPTVKARNRGMVRISNTGSGQRNTGVVVAAVPAIVAGEIIMVFHASHNVTTALTTLNFSTPGSTGLTWVPLIPYPSPSGAQHWPLWFVIRAPLNAYPGGNISLSCDEGPSVTLQCIEWWALEGTSGLTPIAAFDPASNVRSVASVILPAVPAQSRILTSAAQIGPIGSVTWSAFSANVGAVQSGNSAGANSQPAAVADTDPVRNEAFAAGEGLTTVAGDTTVSATFVSAAYKPGIVAIAYQPKSVIGGGTVVMNYERGPGNDTLTVPNGVAELWFRNDGVTVDVRTPKP